MKKIFSIVFTLIICLTAFSACEKTDTNGESTHTSQGTVSSNVPATVDTNSKENMGGYAACEIHHHEYHSISFDLIEYIGKERFFEWTELDEGKELIAGCSDNKTLYDCIHYFDIPRSVLEEIYVDSEWSSDVWNLDVLYAEDKSVSEQFYRNKEQIDSVLEKRAALSDIKYKIFEDNRKEWVSLYGNFVPGPQHSIEYLVELFDISRTELEGYIAEVGAENTYEYNLDLLYPSIQQGGSVGINSVGNTDTSDMTPIEKDALFCGIDDLYIE